MQRRTFLSAAGGVVASGAAIDASASQTQPESAQVASKFSMHFAPHFGMFRHHAGDDLVAQLEFAADQGFTAWEDNGMRSRSIEEQEKLASAMGRLGIRMGVFVLNPDSAWGPTFSQGKQEDLDNFAKACQDSVEVAKRVNAKWMTVVPGTMHPRIDVEYQTAYAVEQLRLGAEILEPHNLVMVLEPLNPRNHPNMLLAKMSHAFEICRAVNSPACKILCDIYHQQITEGNLIPNIDRAWSEIGYFQMGDNPGRNEPTTGEINYSNVFRHIQTKGFAGILGMEHGNSKPDKAGEQDVIDAYRTCEPSES
jgi:hydroxypyruvate isomerase